MQDTEVHGIPVYNTWMSTEWGVNVKDRKFREEYNENFIGPHGHDIDAWIEELLDAYDKLREENKEKFSLEEINLNLEVAFYREFRHDFEGEDYLTRKSNFLTSLEVELLKGKEVKE